MTTDESLVLKKPYELNFEQRSALESMLQDAQTHALRGETHYMERSLLGIAASGCQDETYFEQAEQIQATGYMRMITRTIEKIKKMSESEKQKKLHPEIFALLHAGSMAHKLLFKTAVKLALQQNHSEAYRAIKDFCPTLDYASQSMMEHHKIRNERNYDYFEKIIDILEEEAGMLLKDYFQKRNHLRDSAREIIGTCNYTRYDNTPF